MAASIDDRGRVLIPKALRESLGLTAGSPVIIEADDEGIRIRRALPKTEALRRLSGAINHRNRRSGAEPIDPLELKRMWEPTP